MDFFHRVKRLKSQRFEDWLCLRHQVKNRGEGTGNMPNLLRPID
jgi:hypothetical protein